MDNEDKREGMERLSEGEEELVIIHKHPFGIAIIYLETIFAYIVSFGLISFTLPQFAGEGALGRASTWIGVAAVIVLAFLIIFLLIATAIYRQSKLTITNKNLTELSQIGLFNRSVSELSMSNVEDVKAEQRGIFASIFGFGTLRIETAGEQENFKFTYCPRPNYYGGIVLAARQRYIDGNPVAAKRANERLDIPEPVSITTPPSPVT